MKLNFMLAATAFIMLINSSTIASVLEASTPGEYLEATGSLIMDNKVVSGTHFDPTTMSTITVHTDSNTPPSPADLNDPALTSSEALLSSDSIDRMSSDTSSIVDSSMVPNYVAPRARSARRSNFDKVLVLDNSSGSDGAFGHIIRAKPGTVLKDFQDFIEAFNGNIDIIIPVHAGPEHGYLCTLRLTPQQAGELQDDIDNGCYEFIEEMFRDGLVRANNEDYISRRHEAHSEPGPFFGPSRPPFHVKNPESKQTSYPAFLHQRMMSARYKGDRYSTGDDREFITNESEGKGITLFVIDSGFDDGHPEFDDTNRENDTKLEFVPKEYFRDETSPVQFETNDQDIKDYAENDGKGNYNGHGTIVAAMAAGRYFSVAPKANIHGIKHALYLSDKDDQEHMGWDKEQHSRYATYKAFDMAFDEIEKNDLQGKAIIVYTTCEWISTAPEPEKSLRTWQETVNKSTRLGVPIVACACNDRLKDQDVGKVWPQALRTDDNAIVNVGGVDGEGKWDIESNPASIEPEVKIDIYALSVEVDVPIMGDRDGNSGEDGGTSLAAPIIAGVIAKYMQTNPELFTGHPSTFCAKVKEFLESKSRPLCLKPNQNFKDMEKECREVNDPKETPDSKPPNVGFNNWYEDLPPSVKSTIPP